MSNVNVFEINPDTIDPVRSRKSVLAMQATGLYVMEDERFETANERLVNLAKHIGEPATMTYADVVIHNPPRYASEDTRVFSTDPEVGTIEADFYQTHNEIEARLDEAIRGIRFMGQNPGLYGKGRASYFTFGGGKTRDDEFTAPESIVKAIEGMRGLHQRISPEQFNAFRPYFVGLNGYPGPSGLYSAAIPVLDLLINGGENISPDERAQMFVNLKQGLYPAFGGNNLLLKKLLLLGDPRAEMPDKAREKLQEQLDTFRRTHIVGAKKLVPQAMDGTADGSGGVSNVADYLRSKIVHKEGEQND